MFFNTEDQVYAKSGPNVEPGSSKEKNPRDSGNFPTAIQRVSGAPPSGPTVFAFHAVWIRRNVHTRIKRASRLLVAMIDGEDHQGRVRFITVAGPERQGGYFAVSTVRGSPPAVRPVAPLRHSGVIEPFTQCMLPAERVPDACPGGGALGPDKLPRRTVAVVWGS